MSNPTPTAPSWLRAIFVALALAAWFATQAMLGARPDREEVIGDEIHDAMADVHRYLTDHSETAHGLLIATSAIIDALGIFLLGATIFGRTLRPFVGLLLLFAMRQLCQMLCPLRSPPGIIWDYPGLPSFFAAYGASDDRFFPSLLVTYGVSNDMFFSGHTAMAVLGAVELVRFGGRWWLPVGILIALVEATTVLALRAHYTMDVFTGAVVALYASVLAERWCAWRDALLARVRGDDSSAATPKSSCVCAAEER